MIARNLSLAMLLLALVGCQTDGKSASTAAPQAASAPTGKVLALRALDSRRVKTQEVCAQEYQYMPTAGLRLFWEQGIATPGSAAPGESITLTQQYALLGTRGGMQVSVKHGLYQGETERAALGTSSVVRGDGAWADRYTLDLPPSLAAGDYTVRTEITVDGVPTGGLTAFSVR